jgi:hypothetical protein
MSIEKSNDVMKNRTRDLPACSIVPQPITLPRAPKSDGKLLDTLTGLQQTQSLSWKTKGMRKRKKTMRNRRRRRNIPAVCW